MKRWHWMGIALCALAAFGAERMMEFHGDHWWSSIPGFYALFGFVGCAVIIFFSKALGKLFLQQREDYYDAG